MQTNVRLLAFTEFSHHMGTGRPAESLWTKSVAYRTSQHMKVCGRSPAVPLTKRHICFSVRNSGRPVRQTETVGGVYSNDAGVPNRNMKLSMSPLAHFVIRFLENFRPRRVMPL